MYFDSLPKISYPYNKQKKQTILPDIFRRAILDKFFKNRAILERYYVKDFETQVQFYITEMEREYDCNNQVEAVEKKTENTIKKQDNMIDGFIRLIQAVKEMEDEKDTDNS